MEGSWWVLVVEFVILFGFSFVLLWNLAPKLFPKRWFLYLLVLFGWSLAGITVFLAIHDIWMTEYLLCVRKCHKPFITIPLDQLQTAWLVVYWSSIGLCFLVFPFTISYVNAPDFGIPRKIWRGIQSNLLIYGIIVVTVVAGGVSLLIFDEFSFQGLRGIVMFVSNLWTTLLLMFFLGLGLVKAFTLIYGRANLKSAARRHERNSIQFSIEKRLEKDKMTKLMTKLKSIRREDVGLEKERLLDRVIAKLADSRWGEEFDQAPSDVMGGPLTRDHLTILNGKAKKRLYKRERAEALEEHHFKKSEYFHDLIGERDPKRVRGCERFHKIVIEPILLYSLTIMFFLLSLIVVAFELTAIFLKIETDLDLQDYTPAHYFFDELNLDFSVKLLIAFVVYLYMGYAAFVGVLRFRLFNLYRVLWHHTDLRSLMFSASWAVQLAPLLAYNFMTITTLQGAALNQVFNFMDIIPYVGIEFRYYLPPLCGIVFVCALFHSCCTCCCCRNNKLQPIEEVVPLVSSPNLSRPPGITPSSAELAPYPPQSNMPPPSPSQPPHYSPYISSPYSSPVDSPYHDVRRYSGYQSPQQQPHQPPQPQPQYSQPPGLGLEQQSSYSEPYTLGDSPSVPPGLRVEAPSPYPSRPPSPSAPLLD